MKTAGAFVAISGALYAVAAAPSATLAKRAITPVTVKGNG
jgi:hypothetical protein